MGKGEQMELHMVKPRPLQLARATACSEEVAFALFDAYQKFLAENNISNLDQIFSCDESGLLLQMNSVEKVCAEKVVKPTLLL